MQFRLESYRLSTFTIMIFRKYKSASKVVILLICLSWSFLGNSQEHPLSSQKGQSSFGFGLGLPYGGFGFQFAGNFSDGLQLFAGLGYQLVNLGYQVGCRAIFQSQNNTQLYFSGMYGTNAVIKIDGLRHYNKVYSGITFGTGLKIDLPRSEGNYWNIGLLVPLRSDRFKQDKATVKSDRRVADLKDPLPILIEAGFCFALNWE